MLAVVEELANPAMAAAMLEQQPLLNVLSPLGVSAEAFALVAGCVEVLFGGTELIGQLPVYGVTLTLLLLGSDPRTAPYVRAFMPVRVPQRV